MKMKKSANQVLVIFGASGDLTKRKLIPALYDLYLQDLLPEKFAVLGASRTKLSDEDFREKADEYLPENDNAQKFKKLLFYEPVSPFEPKDFGKLKNRLNKLGNEQGIDANYIFYLSTPPSVYGEISKNLSEAGLSKSEKYFRR